MDSLDSKLLKLSKIFSNEEASFSYILRKLKQRQCLSCVNCGYEDFYLLSRNRLKCKKCRKEFRPLADTKFALLHIPCTSWLSIIRMFAVGYTTKYISKEVGLCYKTTLKAVHILQEAILEVLSYQDPYLKKALFEKNNNQKTADTKKTAREKKYNVFGIIEFNGFTSVHILKHISLTDIVNGNVKKARKGTLIYTDRWQGYDTVMLYGYNELAKKYHIEFTDDLVYIDSVVGFWSKAKPQLNNRRMSNKQFLYFLKEMEWRYNNRSQSLFDLLIHYLLMLSIR